MRGQNLNKNKQERKKVDYLALLSIEPMVKIIKKLKEKRVLTTRGRIKMFILIDGQRTSKEIARKSNVTARAANIFFKELSKKGFIRQYKKGRSLIPVKNYEKIIENLLLSD